MEVHKHPHHVMEKKNWGEYLLEFSMLFLAVFLGFIAENIRESYTEGHRAKEYIASYYDDLRSDTTKITRSIDFDEEKVRDLQDLGSCYDAVAKNNTACLMDVIKSTAINRPYIRTERTAKQLSNAGGFRLLNQEDADSIIAYDEAFNNFQDFQGTVYQDIQNTVRNTLNKLGNFKANAQMFRPQQGQMIRVDTLNRSEVTAPLLFSADKNLLNEYFNELQLYYRVTYNHQRILLELKAQQTRLLGYFKTKYGYE